MVNIERNTIALCFLLAIETKSLHQREICIIINKLFVREITALCIFALFNDNDRLAIVVFRWQPSPIGASSKY